MAKKSKPVKKATKSSARRGATKKKSASKKSQKRIKAIKRISKKKTVASKPTAKKSAVTKKRTTKKAVPKKRSVPKKAAVKKAAPNKLARRGEKITPKRIGPGSTRKVKELATDTDVMTTLRSLTEESGVEPPVEEQPVAPVVKINETDDTGGEPTPWVKIADNDESNNVKD